MSQHWTEEERRAWDQEVNGQRDSATSWAPVDLGPIVGGVQAGEIVGPVPRLMTRTDGACLLYPGEIHSLAGEPESSKGWITLGAVVEIIDTDAVLYLDFEDSPASIVTRLLALGARPAAIIDNFVYVRPSDPFRPALLAALLDARPYALAVVDGVSEAYSLLGLDVGSTPDAVTFLAALPRPIAERGAAVLELDHVAKSKDTRGRFALGAQHKLAGIAAAYGVEVIRPPSRIDAGMVRVRVEKDRHGHVRSHASGGVIAIAHVVPSEGGEQVSVALEAPEIDAGPFRPTGYMQRVSKALEANGGLSKRAVRESVHGKAAMVDLALELLVSELYVEARKDGQAIRHYSLRPFLEADDD